MRLLLDTHIYAWYVNEQDNLSHDVKALIDDYDNQLCISSETLRELITNQMPLISADTKFPFYRNQGLDLIENK